MSSSEVCERVFVDGSDISGPGVRWGLYVQMALSLFVSIVPRVKGEVIISFATSAMVTGIALIATGFTEGQREDLAYYQQALIVQMAGMGFGPAALAWLKRGHGRPDTVFFVFSILYTIVMACYLFYTVGQESTTGPVINCFLDQVPEFYGQRSMKIINSVVLGVSILFILMSMAISRFINRRYYNGLNNYEERPPLNKGVELAFFAFILAAETALGLSVEKTLTEYSQFVTPESRAEASAWQFGQIIPFMMLIQPVMEALRAVMPKVELKRRARQSAGESGGESREGATPSLERKLTHEKSQNGDGSFEAEGKASGVDVKSTDAVEEVV